MYTCDKFRIYGDWPIMGVYVTDPFKKKGGVCVM